MSCYFRQADFWQRNVYINGHLQIISCIQFDFIKSKIITPSKVDTSKQSQFSLRSSDLLELRNCQLERSLMRATGSTSVVLRHVFVPLNQYRCLKIEPKFFRARFVKIPQARLGNAFYANLDTLNSKDFTDKSLNHGEGSQFYLNTQQLHIPVCPKELKVGPTLLTLEKYIFIFSYIYNFLLFFFTINSEHIRKCFLESLCLLLLFFLLFWRL